MTAGGGHHLGLAMGQAEDEVRHEVFAFVRGKVLRAVRPPRQVVLEVFVDALEWGGVTGQAVKTPHAQ